LATALIGFGKMKPQTNDQLYSANSVSEDKFQPEISDYSKISEFYQISHLTEPANNQESKIFSGSMTINIDVPLFI